MVRKMREIFRYKGKHILYNTGEVEETPPEPESAPEKEEALSEEQMKVVLGSMSNNRITDSVKDLVEQAAEKENTGDAQLTEEQMKVVMGSMSDNRITDSVKELVDSM